MKVMSLPNHLWQIIRLKLALLTSGSIFSILVLACTSRQSPKRKGRMHRLGKQLTRVLQNMGPAYIKFGQLLSTRPDLAGKEIGEELALLQDRLPFFSWRLVKQAVRHDLSADISDLFQEFAQVPVAAGSIAQVHKAVTMEGEVVAVKVLRPSIEQRFAQDLALFDFLACIAEFISPEMRRLKPMTIVDTLRQLVGIELDLRLEGAAAGKLAQNLALDRDIYIPKIHWAYTKRRILTSEWIEGTPIYQKEQLLAQGHDMHKLASKLAVTFFNQAFRDGFFHADIHPGNILVNEQGQICLVDFGIMSHLDIANRTFIADILHGFITRDYEKVADLHFAAGYVPAHQDRQLFALACRSVGEPIIGLPVNRISIANLLYQLFEITREFEMETQPQLLMLQKTMVTIEGAGSLLYPEVNAWQLAEPWIMEWGRQNLGWHKKLRDASLEIKGLLYRLNAAIDAIATWPKDRKVKQRSRYKGALTIGFICGIAVSALLFHFYV